MIESIWSIISILFSIFILLVLALPTIVLFLILATIMVFAIVVIVFWIYELIHNIITKIKGVFKHD